MKAFRVTVRGRKRIIAIPGPGVLSVIVGCNQRSGRRGKSQDELWVSLSGLDASDNHHVTWGEHKLREGNVVQVEVLPNQKPNMPLKRYPVQSKKDVRAFKNYVRWAARKLGWKVVERPT